MLGKAQKYSGQQYGNLGICWRKLKLFLREEDRKKVVKFVKQLEVTVNEIQWMFKHIHVYRNRVALMC